MSTQRRDRPVPTYRAPSTPVEVRVAELWRTILDLDRVGADDNFFALGGDSIHAMRVFARVQSELGVRVPLGVLFADPVLAAFCTRLDSLCAAAEPAGGTSR
jgi:aryl carrier-like protein